MSQISKNNSGGGGGTPIVTINGDIGSITGSTVTIFADQAAKNSGSSVEFVNSGTTSTLNVTDARGSTYIGRDAGNLISSSTGGNDNTATGISSLSSIANSGNVNCSYGAESLNALTTGDSNCSYGSASGQQLLTGSTNCFYGYATGQSYTGSESNNILIGPLVLGTVGESGVIRIGDSTTAAPQTTCFIAGIAGVTTSNSQIVTIDTATGQLGASASSPMAYTNVNFAASPYTVLSTDQYISVDSSGGAITLLFPNAPTAQRRWIIKDRTGNSATNNITITTVGGAVTIDGSTSYILNSNYSSIQMLANATPTYEVF